MVSQKPFLKKQLCHMRTPNFSGLFLVKTHPDDWTSLKNFVYNFVIGRMTVTEDG